MLEKGRNNVERMVYDGEHGEIGNHDEERISTSEKMGSG